MLGGLNPHVMLPWIMVMESQSSAMSSSCIFLPVDLNFSRLLHLLSWKCPGHVLDMPSGGGHVLKSQGENQMGDHILHIFSFMCPKHILAVSQVSSLPPGTKNSQINQIFKIYIRKISPIPLWKKLFRNSFFGIAATVLIPNKKMSIYFWNCNNSINSKIKNEVTIKDLLCKHKRCIGKHLSS